MIDDNALPLYEVVKRRISETILEGIWTAGQPLPGEVALAQEYGVAVGTVRRALTDLTAEGMIARRRRTGTVVTGRMPQHSVRMFYQYFRLHRADGELLRSTARVISIEKVRADLETHELLEPRGNRTLLRIHRVRSVDRKPVMHERIWLAASRLPELPTNPDRFPELLYVHLLEKYAIRISAVREEVRAECATAEDKALLKLKTSRGAVLCLASKAFDQANRLTIISRHRASSDGFIYVNEIR